MIPKVSNHPITLPAGEDSLSAVLLLNGKHHEILARQKRSSMRRALREPSVPTCYIPPRKGWPRLIDRGQKIESKFTHIKLTLLDGFLLLLVMASPWWGFCKASLVGSHPWTSTITGSENKQRQKFGLWGRHFPTISNVENSNINKLKKGFKINPLFGMVC